MIFWLTAIVMTAAACLAVLMPLTAAPRRTSDRSELDVAIYKAQLDELAQDQARGAIGGQDAQEARAEIARRILTSAGDKRRDRVASGLGGARRLFVASVVLLVPLVSWGVYAAVGSPDLPSQPLAARLAANPANLTVDELIARAEAHLANAPQDGKGWDVLAPIYARMGRYDDAVAAYRHALRFAGNTPDRQTGLGEALSYAAGGRVTPEAKAAFDQALATDPADAKARFYLATALAQDGRLDQAAADWKAMLATLPQDSPWRGAIGDALAEVDRQTRPAPATADGGAPAAAPGPSSQDVAAASAMAPADRTAMIEQMVAGLDQKLRAEPDNPDGWMRLVRSYAVLGRAGDARDALGRGVKALGADNDAGRKLAELGTSLGLDKAD